MGVLPSSRVLSTPDHRGRDTARATPLCLTKQQNKSQRLVLFSPTSVYRAPTYHVWVQAKWNPECRAKERRHSPSKVSIWSTWIADIHLRVLKGNSPRSVENGLERGGAWCAEASGDRSPERKSQHAKAFPSILSPEQFPSLQALCTRETGHSPSTGRWREWRPFLGPSPSSWGSRTGVVGQLCGFVATWQRRWDVYSQPHTRWASQKTCQEGVLQLSATWLPFRRVLSLIMTGPTFGVHSRACILSAACAADGAYRGRQLEEGRDKQEATERIQTGRWGSAGPHSQRPLCWTQSSTALLVNHETAGACTVVHGEGNKRGLYLSLVICHNLYKCLL